jgi:hypothetical protein
MDMIMDSAVRTVDQWESGCITIDHQAKHGKKWSHVAMRIHTDRAKEAAVVSLP